MRESVFQYNISHPDRNQSNEIKKEIHSSIMQNEYIKTWPDIMKGKKILYVHGFASSGQSGTVTLLRTLLPSATVIAPDIPIHPAEAMDMLHSVCNDEHPDLIIGTSMGGMMAEMLYGYDRITVNPAFQMGDTMASHGMVGKLTFQNPRRDGVQEMVITKAIVKEYRQLTEQCFSQAADDAGRVFGLFGDNDDVVHTLDIFREHYPDAISFHGGHRLVDNVVRSALIPVVRWIDDRQDTRQREIVYIDYDALHDSHGQATPSMRKAIYALLDTYDIRFVAKAPAYDVAYYKDVLGWLSEYVNVPAYGHTIFTNTPETLYGDFYISPTPPASSMATAIKYGSEQFKTWEEVITFFSRLG